jgi:hypothetical protein
MLPLLKIEISLCHVTAGVSATFACFGALLAMVHHVLGTFGGAGFACNGAECTHSFQLRTSRSDRACSKAANFRTLVIHCDATAHWFWVILL